MVKTYLRPDTLEEALSMLSNPDAIPLGGGTFVNSPAYMTRNIIVVDLQALEWSHIHKHGNNLEIKACVTLQQLLENEHTPEALKTAIKLDAPINIRNMGTIAGALVACDGRSPFATAMLALDTKLTVAGGLSMNGTSQSTSLALGNFLPAREELIKGKLITKVTIPLSTKLAYEYVARTPGDKPIVCVALSQWPSGRTRITVGGWSDSPTLAMDGNETSGVEDAARSIAHDANDEWASAAYRSDVAAILAMRCLEAIK